MRVLVALPIVMPLLGAALTLVFIRLVAVQRAIAVTVMVATFGATITLFVGVERDGPAAVQAGSWPAPAGITLVADLFAVIMLVISAGMALAVLIYALGQHSADESSPYFHPVYLILTTGVSASFLAGDLFNLFVAFEVMLSASYVLITLGASRQQIRTGMTYVVISLLASTLFVAGVALVYAATGTVNMADLAGKMGELPEEVRTALALLFLVVFGVKAAIFPLFFWLPDSYPAAPTPITAIFAGLLTKVGVYAIIRSQTLFLSGPRGPSTVILTLAGLTMLIGVLGAIAQSEVKRILSFHIVSQIGYMVMGLGFFTLAGIAGAIFYIVHHIVVKTTLFLVGGIVEHTTGTSRLVDVNGLLRRAPVLALLFALPALSLAGVPPFSGFVAKVALVQAGFGVDRYVVVGVSLLVSLFTLFSMGKIWSGVFWGKAERLPIETTPPGQRLRAPRLMVGSTAALVVTSLVIVVLAGPVYRLTERAAADLINPSAYIEVVLDR